MTATTAPVRRYRAKDIAALGFPQSTVYHWINMGELQAVRIGGSLFIPKDEYDRLAALSARITTAA
ncbi:helix-turn-helix domain-containing protein [Actinosynnema sp. NPDC002837]